MSSSQSVPRLIALLALAAAAAVLGLIATGRLSTDKLPGLAGDDASARQALERVFADEGGPKSGKFSGSLTAKPDDGAAARSGNVQLTGAFVDSPVERREKLFFDASASIAGQQMRFGVLAANQKVFIGFSGSYYEVPRSALRQETSSSQLGSLGIDPNKWIENVTDEGSETVGGVETTHVSAGFDVGQMVDDLVVLAQQLGNPGASPDEASEVKDSIKGARLDAYVGKADGFVRRVTFHATVETPAGGGDLDAEFTLTDVNKPQRIVAPSSSRPFSQLESALRSGGLQSLIAQGGAAEPPVTAPAPPDTGAAEKPAPPDDRTYLGCVRKAATATALQRCSSRLP